MVRYFNKIEGEKIPLVTAGTSPFIGAGQFGFKGLKWRETFLNNSKAMVEILEASYHAGAKGIEAIPVGKIIEATRIMVETYGDYIVTGSTYPSGDNGIEALVEVGAKLIFVHGIISDKRDQKLIELLDEIDSRGIIPGIATHDPIPTIEYAIENSLNVRAFLIPFNAKGDINGNQKDLEAIVNTTKKYSFIGMKTLAAGTIDPKKAFKYISKHNIKAVTIGMVTVQEAESSTKIALKYLKDK